MYFQTPLHNGLVRVSIKADGDTAMLTFLDTQLSAVLSVPPSYLQFLHLFLTSQLLSHMPSLRDAHTFTHQRFPTDILSVRPTLDL